MKCIRFPFLGFLSERTMAVIVPRPMTEKCLPYSTRWLR